VVSLPLWNVSARSFPTLESRPNDACQDAQETDNDEITGRHKKRRRLQSLFGYQATPHHRSDSDSGEDQLARYIELINREDLDADDQFDACFRSEFDKLWPLFSRLWCVPATSAPVERIFSQSGIIMRPHRAKMSDELLETIMFLKCYNWFNDFAQTALQFFCHTGIQSLPMFTLPFVLKNGYFRHFSKKFAQFDILTIGKTFLYDNSLQKSTNTIYDLCCMNSFT
jgi:hypothetical protein